MTRKYLFHLDVTMVEVTSLTTRIELLTVSAVTVEQMVYYDVVREFKQEQNKQTRKNKLTTCS
jgi:hypothetical protein